jgi:hypothetical protein
MTTTNLKDVTQDFIRAPYAWPGGYTKLALCHDGEVLCHTCTKENYRLIREAQRSGDLRSGWHVDAVDVHWEGEPLQCANCNNDLPSEYGGLED